MIIYNTCTIAMCIKIFHILKLYIFSNPVEGLKKHESYSIAAQ